jgi:hypothetical protein
MPATDVPLSTTDKALVDEIVHEIEGVLKALKPNWTVSKFEHEIIVNGDGFAPAEVREAMEMAVMAYFRDSHSGRLYPGRLLRSIHIHRPSYEDIGGPGGEQTRCVVRVTVKPHRM